MALSPGTLAAIEAAILAILADLGITGQPAAEAKDRPGFGHGFGPGRGFGGLGGLAGLGNILGGLGGLGGLGSSLGGLGGLGGGLGGNVLVEQALRLGIPLPTIQTTLATGGVYALQQLVAQVSGGAV
jgi:hypothetical protein